MAVTKIRKISSWTLLMISVVSIIVLGMFYTGGVVDASVEMKEPNYTGLLINWTSILFFVTVVSTLIFALWQFITLLKVSPKTALTSLVVLVCFAAVFFVTYLMGDATPLKGLNADSQLYNVPLWLKVTDMWIQSTIVLMALIVIAVVYGSVKRVLNK